MKQLKWLGKKEELALKEKDFKGKLAGKAWEYSRHIDAIIRTRAIILLASIVVVFPILTNWLLHDIVNGPIIIERIIFSVVLILSTILFNRFRIVSIFLATIPIILIILSYFITPRQFNLRSVSLMGAILFLIIVGIFHHIKAQKLRKELDNTSIENQLVE